MMRVRTGEYIELKSSFLDLRTQNKSALIEECDPSK